MRFGPFGKKKDENPMYQQTGRPLLSDDDVSDDGGDGNDVKDELAPDDDGRVMNFAERRISMGGPEEQGRAEYEASVKEFEENNPEQKSQKARSGMTSRKTKSLPGMIVQAIRRKLKNFGHASSNLAQSAKEEKNLMAATVTDQEKKYKGLKKTYIVVGVVGFFIVVACCLVFFNGSDNTSKSNPAISESEQLRTSQENAGGVVGNPVLVNVPKNYSEISELQVEKDKKSESEKLHEDAKNDDRSKANEKVSARNAAAVSKPANVQAPEVPQQPSRTRTAEVVRDPAVKLKEDAMKSDISFRISNDGLKK